MRLNAFRPAENPMNAIVFCFGNWSSGRDSRSEEDRSYEDDFGFSSGIAGGYSGSAADIGGRDFGDDDDGDSRQVATPAPASPAIRGEVIRGTAPAARVQAPVDTRAIAAESFGRGQPDRPFQPSIAAPSVSFPEQAALVDSLLGTPQVSEFVGPAGMGLISDGLFSRARVPVEDLSMQGDISPYSLGSAQVMAPSAYASQGVPRVGDITRSRAVQLDLAVPQGTSSADMDRPFGERVAQFLGLSQPDTQRVAFQVTVDPETGSRDYGPVMQEAPTQFGEQFGRAIGNMTLGMLGLPGLGFNLGDVRGYIDPVTGERYQYSEVGGLIPGLFGEGEPQLRSYEDIRAEQEARMADRDNGGDDEMPAADSFAETQPPPIVYAQLPQLQYRTPQFPVAPRQPMATNWYDIPERFRGSGLLG